ncbi:MAG: hypothetical protein ACHQYQ_01865 [Bacteriovoracales bacterium]
MSSLSLKEQLLKAGFKQTPKPAPKPKPEAKKPAPPAPIPQKPKHSHQGHRTFCENCKNILPDVEFYNHRNPDVTGKWICTDCADKNWIPDEVRTTAQSEASRNGIFKRAFGKTFRDIQS